MKTIVVTTKIPEKGLDSLKGKFNLIFPENKEFSRKELLQFLPQAEVLVSTFNYKIDSELMDAAQNLKMIANFGVGINNIDVCAAQERGILVTNTPNPVTEPTAEQAMNLLLAVSRRTAELDRKLRTTNDIEFGVMCNLGTTLYGKTLGIVGMGKIGQATARRALAFGMKIIYTKRTRLDEQTEKMYHAEYQSLEELLKNADVVSLHTPYTSETHHLIGEKEFALMKNGSILINTARGQVVDEQALIKNLKNGKLFGAGLDVFEFEPKISPELLQMDNVVLAPHVGTGTYETRLEIAQNVAENVLKFYEKSKK